MWPRECCSPKLARHSPHVTVCPLLCLFLNLQHDGGRDSKDLNEFHPPSCCSRFRNRHKRDELSHVGCAYPPQNPLAFPAHLACAWEAFIPPAEGGGRGLTVACKSPCLAVRGTCCATVRMFPGCLWDPGTGNAPKISGKEGGLWRARGPALYDPPQTPALAACFWHFWLSVGPLWDREHPKNKREGGGGTVARKRPCPLPPTPTAPARRLFLAVCGTFVGPIGQERNKREGGGGTVACNRPCPL